LNPRFLVKPSNALVLCRHARAGKSLVTPVYNVPLRLLAMM